MRLLSGRRDFSNVTTSPRHRPYECTDPGEEGNDGPLGSTPVSRVGRISNRIHVGWLLGASDLNSFTLVPGLALGG